MAGPESRRTQRQREAGPRKGDLREAQILDALERLLATKAFADVTMDDIARQAGLSRPALYFYFASKERVLSALHYRTYRSMGATTDPLMAAGEVSFDAMRRAIAQVVQNWREHTAALRTFHEMAAASPEFGDEWRERLAHHVITLAELIQRERDANRASPDPCTAHAVASAWFWMLESSCYELFRREHERADEDELVETLARLWVRSIGAPEPNEGTTSPT